jgi:ubiquinone/menaquinone biosynthesis C-methylase UbiE
MTDKGVPMAKTKESNKTTPLKNTGERMIPAFHKGTLIYAEHITRYQAVEELLKDKIILDIASGSGYGTNLMAKTAKKVYGVDVDKDAVKYAQANFSKSNIEFKVGDGEKIPLEDNSVDVVVTFETIEHIPDYKKFLSEVKRVLKPDGIAIVSTPNDLEFAEGNHFHLHEFVYKELMNLLKKDYKYIDPYFQATWKYVALGGGDLFLKEGRVDIETVNYAPLKPEQYLYFYLVCSNKQITEKITPRAAIGGHYSDRETNNMVVQLEKNITNLVKDNEHLRKLLVKEKDAKQNKIDELAAIKNSRSYKTAVKVNKLKNRLTSK